MELATVYAQVMMKAAVVYCEQHGIKIDAEHLSQCLKAHKETIRGALKDAKDALDANMPQVAETTFRASAAQAGIAAAQMYQLEKTGAA